MARFNTVDSHAEVPSIISIVWISIHIGKECGSVSNCFSSKIHKKMQDFIQEAYISLPIIANVKQEISIKTIDGLILEHLHTGDRSTEIWKLSYAKAPLKIRYSEIKPSPLGAGVIALPA